MRLLLAVCFIVNVLAVIAAISAKSSTVIKANQTPSAPVKKYADNMMVCNLLQDSHVSEAIKTLETKLENLIALVNKSLTPQPTPPGKVNSHIFSMMIFLWAVVASALLNFKNGFLFVAAGPVSSCKEQYDKHK